MYKFGARFSRRSIEEILEDVGRAESLYRAMEQRGITEITSFPQAVERVNQLAEEIRGLSGTAGREMEDTGAPRDIDPRLE